jgi:HEPN domain-containing protein
MKGPTDLIQGWLRKAASDLTAMEASFKAGALDAACFHAQQASEKYLKAFLTSQDQSFPYTHNLAKLIGLCAQTDSAFKDLLPFADLLTPYAVEMRYDAEFWPSAEAAARAQEIALEFKHFVLSRIGHQASNQ